MSDEETKQNGQTKAEGLTKTQVQIICAIIGAAAVVIAAIITAYALRPVTIEVYLINKETNQGISGNVFIDTENNGVRSVPDRPAVIKVKRGDQYIRAESDDYKSELVPIARVAKTLTIPMEMTAVTVPAQPTPLSFTGWSAWNDEITLRQGVTSNEIIINGATDDATGFSNNNLPTTLRGRTLILYFSNTGVSNFSRNRMVKLAYNRNDTLLSPTNASLLNREYLPNEDTPLNNGIEFLIPNDFNGKLNFTFYQAELNDLKITAFYR